MGLSRFCVSLQDVWPILAMWPCAILCLINMHKWLHPSLKGKIYVALEYLIVFQAIFFLFDELYWPHGTIVPFLIVFFSWASANVVWLYTPDCKKKILSIVLHWLFLFALFALALHVLFDVSSMHDAIELWYDWISSAIHYFVYTIKRICRTLTHLYHLSIEPVGAIFSIFAPLWVVVYDGDMWRQIKSQETHLTVSFLAECVVVILALRWMFHHHILAEPFAVIEVTAVVSDAVMWYVWTFLTMAQKRYISKLVWFSVIMGLVVIFCQLVWGVHFFAALSIIWRQFIVRGFILFRGKIVAGFARALAWTRNWWTRAITYIAEFTFVELKRLIVFSLKKMGERGVIKIGIFTVITQLLANKTVKAFKNEKAQRLKRFVGEKKDKTKAWFDELPFEQKLFLSLLSTCIIWLVALFFGHSAFIYPIFPTGTGIKILKFIRLLRSGFFWLAKKLGINKFYEFLLLLFAKSIFGKMSEDLRYKLYLFRKWKLGRFFINNNEFIVVFDKEARDKLRRLRQLEIEHRKKAAEALKYVRKAAADKGKRVVGEAVNRVGGVFVPTPEDSCYYNDCY